MSLGPAQKPGHTTLSEINVTPLVDVMLVLLIIFMITAPMLQQGMDVNLPPEGTGNLDLTQERFIITLGKNERIYLNDRRIDLSIADLDSLGVGNCTEDQRGLHIADGGLSHFTPYFRLRPARSVEIGFKAQMLPLEGAPHIIQHTVDLILDQHGGDLDKRS